MIRIVCPHCGVPFLRVTPAGTARKWSAPTASGRSTPKRKNGWIRRTT